VMSRIRAGRYVLLASVAFLGTVLGSSILDASTGSDPSEPRTYSTLRERRTLARMRKRLQRDVILPQESPQRCFAETEALAEERLIAKLLTSQPAPAPLSMGVFLCEDGTSEEERSAISTIMHEEGPQKPLLFLGAADGGLSEAEAHSIVQQVLGRERYREQLNRCREKANDSFEREQSWRSRTLAEVLDLTPDQRALIDPLLKENYQRMYSSGFGELNDDGTFVEAPVPDVFPEFSRQLELAERVFDVLTDSQKVKYRGLFHELRDGGTRLLDLDSMVAPPEVVIETMQINEELSLMEQ